MALVAWEEQGHSKHGAGVHSGYVGTIWEFEGYVGGSEVHLSTGQGAVMQQSFINMVAVFTTRGWWK